MDIERRRQFPDEGRAWHRTVDNDGCKLLIGYTGIPGEEGSHLRDRRVDPRSTVRQEAPQPDAER
ncbi:hypothetical protein GCM10027610_022810 [Dactylosporangium cerinum]